MKRVFAVLLSLSLFLSACSGQAATTDNNNNTAGQVEQTADPKADSSVPDTDSAENTQADNSESAGKNSAPTDTVTAPTDYSYDINLNGVTTLDELEDRIDEDLTKGIDFLNSQWETLSAEIDTYQKYVDNKDRVSGFYEFIVTHTEKLCIMLKEYSAAYARMVLDSDMDNEDKYKAIDGINDKIYDDACDEIKNKIYEDLLDDMKDHFYEGILDEKPDNVEYEDWYDTCSNEYGQWYDTSSDVYGLYYNTASDIYSFYYDMSGVLYSGDSDRAEKKYSRFLERIEKEKNPSANTQISNAAFDTTLRSASNTEELETVVEAHVSECIQALQNEWQTLSANTDTYEKYASQVDTVEDFHTHIKDSASQIMAMVCDYGALYTELVLQSGSSPKDMYDAFEGFKDCIYEDALEMVKDGIYDDLLDDIKDYYYDGVIKDAKKSIPYSDWSDAHSDAYSWWSDTRSDIYSAWSDTRSEVYGFYSDIRSELYSEDLDGANDELQDFKKKVEKMK